MSCVCVVVLFPLGVLAGILRLIVSIPVSYICTSVFHIRKTCPCNNRDFLALEFENFRLKNFDIFLIFVQNIDCGYTLEPPR